MPDAAPTTPTEIVERPDPGLGRGKWEGSPRLIVGLSILVLVGFATFILWKVQSAKAKRRRGSEKT